MDVVYGVPWLLIFICFLGQSALAWRAKMNRAVWSVAYAGARRAEALAGLAVHDVLPDDGLGADAAARRVPRVAAGRFRAGRRSHRPGAQQAVERRRDDRKRLPAARGATVRRRNEAASCADQLLPRRRPPVIHVTHADEALDNTSASCSDSVFMQSNIDLMTSVESGLEAHLHASGLVPLCASKRCASWPRFQAEKTQKRAAFPVNRYLQNMFRRLFCLYNIFQVTWLPGIGGH